MNYSLYQIAKMIDHSLLHPTMTDADLVAGCELAKKYEVAAVCIKPYFVKQAVELLKDSGVAVCTVVGFPHGSSTIQQKVSETRQACKEGASEIDMVVNIGKVLSEDWRYIKKEINTILLDTKWNYLEMRDAETMSEDLTKSSRITLVAVYQLGSTRLLDNLQLEVK